MPTIKEKLTELREKIYSAEDHSEVNEEVREEYRIRQTTLGIALNNAISQKSDIKKKHRDAEYELRRKQEEVDALARELEVAEYVVNSLANQECP